MIPHLMYDSVTVAGMPGGEQATAGYVDGLYRNSDAMLAAFPGLPHITIAVFPWDDAMALDVENGDATVADAPAWVDRQHARGLALPIVYSSASNTAALRAVLGSRAYLLWTAHYDGNPHICGSCGYPEADATQFIDRGPNGENVDQTLMSDRFFQAIGGVVAGAPTATPAAPAPSVRKAPTMVIVTQKEEGTWALGPGYRHELSLTEEHALLWDNPPASLVSAFPLITLEDGPVGQARFVELVAVWTQPNAGTPAATTPAVTK